MTIRLLHGDCREVLAGLAAEGVEACVTDPPYHLTTGKKGGTGVASLNPNSPAGRSVIGTGFMGKAWDGGNIAQDPEMWAAVLRVLKPGAHLAAFGGTRTFHRMMCAIEDAGFEIRDTLMWVYGSGFPKSHNQPGGFGTALKPAWEPIVLARKPLQGTVAVNIAKHGTGVLNIDGCRVATGDTLGRLNHTTSKFIDSANGSRKAHPRTINVDNSGGARWPANICHDGSPEVLDAFAAFGSSESRIGKPRGAAAGDGWGMTQTGAEYADTGTAARFFYTAKASSSERGKGNNHPTVKPLALMQWLCRLVTPTGGTVLDPFTGSGSTLVAADREGFHGIGIEMDAEYVEIARRRIYGDAPLFADVA